MSNEKYEVHLSEEERGQLNELSRNGSAPAKKISHARVLLMSDQHHSEGRWTDEEIGGALKLHVNTVARIRKRFVQEGQEPALSRKPRLTPARITVFDGEKEAQLVAICCSAAPQGYAKWSLSLLVGELKGRGIVTQVSRETVRQVLKKMNFNLGERNAIASLKETQPASAPRWKKSSGSTPAHTARTSR